MKSGANTITINIYDNIDNQMAVNRVSLAMKKVDTSKEGNVICYTDGIAVSTTNKRNVLDVYYCSVYDKKNKIEKVLSHICNIRNKTNKNRN